MPMETFAPTDVSEFLRWRNGDVKPRQWFSNRVTERSGPSERHHALFVLGELHV